MSFRFEIHKNVDRQHGGREREPLHGIADVAVRAEIRAHGEGTLVAIALRRIELHDALREATFERALEVCMLRKAHYTRPAPTARCRTQSDARSRQVVESADDRAFSVVHLDRR